MKTILTILSLMVWTVLQAQDGSDIKYVKTNKLDSTHIGQLCHLDFYNRSFGGMKVDTVTIDFNGKPTKFAEHRVDNGYDNWFNQQYLESIEPVDGVTIRIYDSRIDSITTDKIRVSSMVTHYDEHGNQVHLDKGFAIAHWFTKDIIVEVLIKN